MREEEPGLECGEGDLVNASQDVSEGDPRGEGRFTELRFVAVAPPAGGQIQLGGIVNRDRERGPLTVLAAVD